MIQFADETTRKEVCEMWKTVFDDPDDYIDLYFRHKYRNENSLLYLEGGRVAASLQMLPYQFTFCGTEIPVLYLSGVSALPAYRGKGYVRQLLTASFEEAARRNVPLMLLVPQEEWLLKFYGRFGFAQTFDAGTEELPGLEALSGKYRNNPRAAYKEFDALFRQSDMTVQKSFDDFCTIMEEAALYDFPAKKNLQGMARIIDAERLLSLFAAYYPQQSFSVIVEDELVKRNYARFTVSQGKVNETPVPEFTDRASVPDFSAVRPAPVPESSDRAPEPDFSAVRPAPVPEFSDRLPEPDFSAVRLAPVPEFPVVEPQLTTDIRNLAQLLTGYHTSEKRAPFNIIFPEKNPQMHYMLE